MLSRLKLLKKTISFMQSLHIMFLTNVLLVKYFSFCLIDAEATPIFNKGLKSKVKNYRCVSILPIL